MNCGNFQGALVCSPLHALANLSVAVFGLLTITGSLLLRPALPGGRRRDVAVGLLVVAGLGAFLNAFTPEDVTLTGDTVTALIAFLGANFGLIQVGRTMSTEPEWRGHRIFAPALGTVGTVALILDGLGIGTAMGIGAVEWLIVGPILVWMSVFGVRLILWTRPTSIDSAPPNQRSVKINNHPGGGTDRLGRTPSGDERVLGRVRRNVRVFWRTVQSQRARE